MVYKPTYFLGGPITCDNICFLIGDVMLRVAPIYSFVRVAPNTPETDGEKIMETQRVQRGAP